MSYKQKSPISVVQGGTGDQSFTAYSVITGGTTSTGALQNVSGVGTSGQVLTSNGASALPSWQPAASGGIVTINGTSGSVTGSTITLTGGTSGAVFTGSSSTMTESFNFLALPTTSSTNGQITINSAPFLHGFGTRNLSVGESAYNFTASGTDNVAVGRAAMSSTTSGVQNVAVGVSALTTMSSSVGNTAVGYQAGQSISTGSGINTAIGNASLITCSTGAENVALGYQALQNLSTGNTNLGLGTYGGQNLTSTDSNNIMLHNIGTSGDNNTLRIGSGTGTGARQLNKAFISGIQTITVTGTAVLVSSSDQLGVAVSSARYKENIEDMGDASSNVLKLRPVTFNYTVGDDHSKQTGLIAEEVAEIMPSLVVYDKENMPQTVKYHDISVLLLNELQKALKRIDALEAAVKE